MWHLPLGTRVPLNSRGATTNCLSLFLNLNVPFGRRKTEKKGKQKAWPIITSKEIAGAAAAAMIIHLVYQNQNQIFMVRKIMIPVPPC